MEALKEFKEVLAQIYKRRKESKVLSKKEMILLLFESILTRRWPGGEVPSLSYRPKGIEGKLRKILVIQLSAIGDVVLSTPTIRGLRERYPKAYLAYLVEPIASEIVMDNPYLDEVIIFPKDDYLERLKEETLGGLLDSIASFIDSLKNRGFDLVLNLNPTPSSAYLSYLIDSKNTIGLTVDETGRPFLSGNIWVLYKYKYFMSGREFIEKLGRLNLAEINMRMAGVDPSNRELTIFINEKEKREGEQLLRGYGIEDGDLLIGFNPGSNFESRCWPKERFAQLGDLLVKEYGAKIIIFGGPSEGNLVREIASLMKNRPIIDVPEKTALKRLAVLLKRCSHLITNDTGPMHIAAAVHTPIIGLCGPTRVGAYGNDGHIQIQADLPCIGCSPVSFCQTRECMKRIEVEIVLACLRFQRGEIDNLPVIPGVNIYHSGSRSINRLFSYLSWPSKVKPEWIIGLASLNLWIKENRKLGIYEEDLSLDEIRKALSGSIGFDTACREALSLIKEYERICQEGVNLLQNELYPRSLAGEGLEECIARFNKIEECMNNGVGEFFNFLDYLFLRGQDEIGWRLNLYLAKQEAARYLYQFLEGAKQDG